MSHRDWKFRLEDIAEALDRIFEYTLKNTTSSYKSIKNPQRPQRLSGENVRSKTLKPTF